MSDNELVAFIVSVVTMGVTVMSVARIWFGRNRPRQVDAAPAAPALAGIEQRLERMEQSIDAMALEVERISEGQRFTTRLLSDRAGGAGAAEPAALRAGPTDRS